MFLKTSSKPDRKHDACFGKNMSAGRNLIESWPHPHTENPTNEFLELSSVFVKISKWSIYPGDDVRVDGQTRIFIQSIDVMCMCVSAHAQSVALVLTFLAESNNEVITCVSVFSTDSTIRTYTSSTVQ